LIPFNDFSFNLRITIVRRDLIEAAAVGLVSYGASQTKEIQEAIVVIADRIEGEWVVSQNGELKQGFISGLRLREAEINLAKDVSGLLALSLAATGAGSARQSLLLRFKDGDVDELFARQDGTGFFFKEMFCHWLRRIASYEHQFGRD